MTTAVTKKKALNKKTKNKGFPSFLFSFSYFHEA